MTAKRNVDNCGAGDLFAAVAANEGAGASFAPTIDSPLVSETHEWLSQRAVTLGNMLASERAAEYVACLRALAAFRAHYAVHANDTTKPYPGIPALLSRLAAAGVRMAIVSNKPDFAVRSLAETYFATLMTAAVGAREGVPTKPAPDLVLEAIREMGLTPADCVYVGDSEVDVATAAAAGMRGIAVTWGFRTPDTLRAAGASTLCADVRALEAAL